MKKITVIITSCMIVFGLLIASIGYFSGAKLTIVSNGKGLKIFEEKERVSESFTLTDFTNIQAELNDANVEIIPSTEYKLEIQRYADNSVTHEVKNGTLLLKEQSNPTKFIVNFNLNFNIFQTNIKLYISKDTSFSDVNLTNKYGDLSIDGIKSDSFKININERDLDLNDITTKTMNVANLYGDVQLNNVNSKDFTIHINDGDVDLKNVKGHTLHIINQYGDIAANNLSYDQLNVNNHDGDADFINVTSKNFILNNQYGDIDLNQIKTNGLDLQSNSGNIAVNGCLLGTSKIVAKYGDVELFLNNDEADISYSIVNKYGDISVGNNQYEGSAVKNNPSNNKLEVIANDGDVNLQF